MRNVTIDEIFTWREDFGRKAKEAFGHHYCDASPQTIAEIKKRCDSVFVDEEAYRFRPLPAPLNGMSIHYVSGIPDGMILPCSCKPTAPAFKEANS